MEIVLDHRGEAAALAAASAWALAAVFFRKLGAQFTPIQLNLYKGLLALAMLIATLLLTGDLWNDIPTRAWLLLLASGALGIGLGDTCYFAALNRVGVRYALIMETMAPPIAALLAWLFLRDLLPMRAWFGIAVVGAGLAWVILERSPAGATNQVMTRAGFAFGALAASAQAGGAVLSHAALTLTDVSPMWSAVIRLLAGIGLLPLLLLRRGATKTPATPKETTSNTWLWLAGATLVGTYLGLWLQQVSLKYTSAGIAQTLLVTSPVFGLAIAKWQGEHVSLRALIGVMVVIGGVALIF
ncbi:DMT family transporter [Acanthopleuribacter pedis]|uniref:DMT family transporter n=1 Tax=Acanthopleuribacter pedis TaxID=442870 RepID=A0A8J7QBU7_9BACT|nr:DMT family transporter [Acanthopleuribacter pedis]MBO1320839.1 DMT family transporter [Acanthopleuribacter pedis]